MRSMSRARRVWLRTNPVKHTATRGRRGATLPVANAMRRARAREVNFGGSKAATFGRRGSNHGFPRQGKVGERSVERRCWRSRRGRTHLTLRRRTHGVRRSSGTPPARYNTSCIVLVVFSGSRHAVGLPAPTVCCELGRYFRYFRQVASKRRERGRFVVTSVLAASF